MQALCCLQQDDACGDRDVNAARNLAALVKTVRQVEWLVAGSGSETVNACVRDGKPTAGGGASGNPDVDREAAGSQQSIRM
jgi:transposase